jgi:prephenate dehydrogenase
MKICIVGLGLIGGSMAIDLKRRGFARRIIGVDSNKLHAHTALQMGIVDEIKNLKEGLDEAELIVIATPVDVTCQLLPKVLDQIEDQTLIDVSSTKEPIIQSIVKHKNRRNFVSTHPMAGTENSGPWAATAGLFDGKAVIFTDIEDSDPLRVKSVESLYESLGMRPLNMNAVDHDIHVAFVSHISHISSMALALTVLDKEQNEKNIFNLASGGFDSTVRLAKSSADMWTPIFMQNQKNLLTVLDTYVNKLQDFRALIEQNDPEGMYKLITQANKIRKVLK